VHRELDADHRMASLLTTILSDRRRAELAIRVIGASDWTRRNFARWLFEDEPRAIAVTPRRWHRKVLQRDGAYVDG
jgi:menaquinone-9 beta-reductase